MVKKKFYMIKRWWKIISGKSATAIRQMEGKFYSLTDICGYYNDFSGKLAEGTALDESGIPITVIAGGKRVYFPIAICQYGLGCYDKLLETKNKIYGKGFLATLNYIFEMQGNDGAWNCFGPLESKLFTVSSMCQGEAASLLLRGYVYTGNDKYLSAAKRAIDFMLLSIEDGGTAVYEGRDLFLEEYPREKRMGVLNGWIFSLFGIYDLSIVYPEYRDIFNCSCNTLKLHLKEYDARYWSFYDLDGRIASPAYHDLHIELLKVLNKMYSNDGEYDFYIQKFMAYQNNKIGKTRAILKKILQKLHEDSDCIVVQ